LFNAHYIYSQKPSVVKTSDASAEKKKNSLPVLPELVSVEEWPILMKLEVRKKKRYVDFKPTETVHSFGKLK
jgi:hypothetical protein